MIDLSADRYTYALAKEVDKRINEICAKRPEIMQNRERVILWHQDALIDGQIVKRYWFTLDGNEMACFYVGAEHGEDGYFLIKASDVIYLKN